MMKPRVHCATDSSAPGWNRSAARCACARMPWQDWPDAGSLHVSFSLPPGSYATAVLEQLGTITDAASPVASAG